MIRRRLFLGAVAGLVAAPPIVRAAEIMPIRVERPPAPILPIGTIAAFAAPTLPPGWLPCDGRAFSPELFPGLARLFMVAPGRALTPDLLGVARGALSLSDNGEMTPIVLAIRARFRRMAGHHPCAPPGTIPQRIVQQVQRELQHAPETQRADAIRLRLRPPGVVGISRASR